MIDARHDELLNQEIDGENSPEESTSLRQLVASQPEVRARYEKLTQLARTLERVKGVEAPATLTDDVLRAIGRRSATPSVSPTWRETLQTAFARRPALRYGFAFASGLALGVLGAVVTAQSPFAPVDETSLAGTMLPGSRVSRLETLARESFELDGTRGEAVMRAGPGKLLAEIHLESQGTIELRLRFDPKLLTPLAFQQSGTGRELALSAEDLRLTHSGDGRYALLLSVQGNNAPPLILELHAGDRAFQRILRTGPEGP